MSASHTTIVPLTQPTGPGMPTEQLGADPTRLTPSEAVTEWPNPEPGKLNPTLKAFCEPTPTEQAAVSGHTAKLTYACDPVAYAIEHPPAPPVTKFVGRARANAPAALAGHEFPPDVLAPVDPALLAEATVTSPAPALPRVKHAQYGRVTWVNGEAPESMREALATRDRKLVFDARREFSPLDLYEIRPGVMVYAPAGLPEQLTGTTSYAGPKPVTAGGLNPVGLEFRPLKGGFYEVFAKPGLWVFFPGSKPDPVTGRQQARGWRFPDWMKLRDPFAPGLARPSRTGAFEFVSLPEASRRGLLVTRNKHYHPPTGTWVGQTTGEPTPEAARDGWVAAKDGHAIHFNELLALGYGNYLAEVAGLVDLGNEFRVADGSPLQLNLRHFLYHTLGYLGWQELLTEWLEAHELHENRLGGDTPRLARKHLPLDARAVSEARNDAVFMGATTGEMGNRKTRRAVFTPDRPVNGRSTLRLYHEGSPIARGAKREYVDDDPSPMITLSACRGERAAEHGSTDDPHANEERVDKTTDRRGPEPYLPDGYVRFPGDRDWHPVVPEHGPLLRRILKRVDRAAQRAHAAGDCLLDYRIAVRPADSFHRKVAPWRVEGLGLTGVSLTRLITVYGQPELSPAEYYRLTPDRRVGWHRRRKGFYLTLVFADHVREEFLPLPEASDRVPTATDRQLAIEQGPAAPDRVLRRYLCWSQRKERWFEPFQTTDPVFEADGRTPKTDAAGNPLFRWFTARPAQYNRPAWRMLVRALTELETLRQRLAEERWGEVAFAPGELTVQFAGGEAVACLPTGEGYATGEEPHTFTRTDRDGDEYTVSEPFPAFYDPALQEAPTRHALPAWYDPAGDSLLAQARDEAVKRVTTQVDKIRARVAAFSGPAGAGVEPDAMDRLTVECEQLKLFATQVIHGLRDEPKEPPTEPRKVVPAFTVTDPWLDARLTALAQLRACYAAQPAEPKWQALVAKLDAARDALVAERQALPVPRKVTLRQRVQWMIAAKAAPDAPPTGPCEFVTAKPVPSFDAEKRYDTVVHYSEDLDPQAASEALAYRNALTHAGRFTRAARAAKAKAGRARACAFALADRLVRDADGVLAFKRVYVRAKLARGKARWKTKVIPAQ